MQVAKDIKWRTENWCWVLEDLSDEEILFIAKTQLPADGIYVSTIAKVLGSLGLSEPYKHANLPTIEIRLK
jgi:hypothetical protein